MDRFTLKPMSKDAVPAALAKAERYRLLNEPGEAESICLDILQVDPQNEDALVMMLLALTDQFPHDSSSKTAGTSQRARRPVWRRRTTARITRASSANGARKSSCSAIDSVRRRSPIEWLREAMAFYERAEAVRPPHNDDSLLRWNACARLLMELPAAGAGSPGAGAAATGIIATGHGNHDGWFRRAPEAVKPVASQVTHANETHASRSGNSAAHRSPMRQPFRRAAALIAAHDGPLVVVASALAGITDLLLGGAQQAASESVDRCGGAGLDVPSAASPGRQGAPAAGKRRRRCWRGSTKPRASIAICAARLPSSDISNHGRSTCSCRGANGCRRRSWPKRSRRQAAARCTSTRPSSSPPTDSTAAPRRIFRGQRAAPDASCGPLIQRRDDPGRSRLHRTRAGRKRRDARARRIGSDGDAARPLARRATGRAVEGCAGHPDRRSASRAGRAPAARGCTTAKPRRSRTTAPKCSIRARSSRSPAPASSCTSARSSIRRRRGPRSRRSGRSKSIRSRRSPSCTVRRS